MHMHGFAAVKPCEEDLLQVCILAGPSGINQSGPTFCSEFSWMD